MSAVPAPIIVPVDPIETTRRIADFVRDFSIEATRPTDADLAALKSAAPLNTPIFLSSVPARPPSDLLEFAVRVRANGFEPVPHLAARQIVNTAAFDDLLAQLSARARVQRMLIIAGDSDRTQGPYTSAVDVIDSGLLQRHGITEVGIAGYPDGHPRISNEALDRALAAKIDAAEQTGLGVFIVTQFGFSADRIAGWIARMRDLGVEQQIRIGMAGPTNLATLLRYARRCGVAASAQGLTRQAGLLKHLVGTSAPDNVIRPLAETGGNLGKVSAHFFSFGGAGATARWAAAVSAGYITLDRTDGFGVDPP